VTVSHTYGVNSEFGRLRTVLVHRPGTELRRIGPDARDRLRCHGLPWLAGAQAEHDALAQRLRDRGVEVLYVTELLQDVMEYPSARRDAIGAVLRERRLGEQLRADLGSHLGGLDPEALARVLITGLAAQEFRRGRGVVYGLLDKHDFVIPPLSSLVYVRDTSLWTGPTAVIASPADPARCREAALMQVIYRRHPRFAGSTGVCGPGRDWLDGGDVLQLAPDVVAVGIGERTTVAGVERLAGRLLAAGLVRAVLAVPMRELAQTRLDSVCTVVDHGTVLMPPALAYTLQARVITPGNDGLRVSRPKPFLECAAWAMGAGELCVLRACAGPGTGRQPWEEGGNALAIDQRVVVAHERNSDTNARLEAEGIEVILVPGNELGGGGAGPRSLSCPVSRDPLAAAEPDRCATVTRLALPAKVSVPELLPVAAGGVAAGAGRLARAR
jgi:arginine deiminase